MDNLILLEPVGYLAFLKLMSNAALVLTDSGGIQVETTILGVPCMTLRENTELPITLEEGTNHLVGLDVDSVLKVYKEIKDNDFQVSGKLPRLWDGHAAGRIVEVIKSNLNTTEV